jgi:hypothetical protein
MSNTLINIRVAYWHFQVMRDRPWVCLSFNRYWWDRGLRWSELVGIYH